eukprot:SAG11_NODE_53_length_19648_cov_14.691902_9_plen_71_part_00
MAPWGDVNRDMGMDSRGVISADSEWIWTAVSPQTKSIFAILVVVFRSGVPQSDPFDRRMQLFTTISSAVW